jgi:hypothetical protein
MWFGENPGGTGGELRGVGFRCVSGASAGDLVLVLLGNPVASAPPYQGFQQYMFPP